LRRACLFVCLSVCLFLVRSHVLLTTRSNFVKLSAHDASGRGSDLSWRRCDTLCTCGLVDDVFYMVGPMAACRYRSSVTSARVHGLTSMRRGIVCVLSYTIVSTKTGRVFCARGAEGEFCDAPLLCYFVPSQEECGSIVMSMSACLSVCLSTRITRQLPYRTSPNSYAFGRGSAILWWYFDTLYNFGFVYEVI